MVAGNEVASKTGNNRAVEILDVILRVDNKTHLQTLRELEERFGGEDRRKTEFGFDNWITGPLVLAWVLSFVIGCLAFLLSGLEALSNFLVAPIGFKAHPPEPGLLVRYAQLAVYPAASAMTLLGILLWIWLKPVNKSTGNPILLRLAFLGLLAIGVVIWVLLQIW